MARFERGDQTFEITSEDAEYLAQQRARLRDGWHRVPDPRCESRFDGEPRAPVLEAAMLRDPSDLAAVLVYADWLQQRGHPRGALIAIQHAMTHRPDDAGLRDEEKRVLLEAGEALLSRPLVARMGIRSAHRSHEALELSPRNMPDGGALTWDHGFLRHAMIFLDRRGADEDLCWEILRHPSSRLLSALEIEGGIGRDVELVVALLLSACPPLRSLTVRVHEDREPRRPRPLDLSGLARACPELEHLELEGARLQLGDLALPGLRRLVVRSLDRHHDVAEVLAAAAWPALEELGIARVQAGRLAAAFGEPRFPRLRILRITSAATEGNELCRLVVRSPHASQLEELDLTDSVVDPAAVTLLVESRALLPALATLRVSSELVRENGVERLREAGFPVQFALASA